MSNPVITLTTDFGTADHFVGAMKGVMLRILPGATIVDINHHVAPMDILDGALAIACAYRYFPPRTVHVVVVDPGVGTQRRPILAVAGQYYFVAPDNGVLSLIYEREESVQVRHITAAHYFLHPVSETFHGRDVFAPVAAALAKSYQAAAFGEEIGDFVRFALPRVKAEGARRKGVVLRADGFGNLMTNFTPEDLPAGSADSGRINLQLGSARIQKLVQTFGHGAPGEPVALIGSSGFLEIAVNRGSAARALGAGRGAEVVLEPA